MSKHRTLQKRFATTAPTTRRADEGGEQGSGAPNGRQPGNGRPQPSRGQRGPKDASISEAGGPSKIAEVEPQYTAQVDPSGGSSLLPPPYEAEQCLIQPSPSIPGNYPRPGQTVGEYRDEARQSIADWVQPGCDLPVNPDAGPQAFHKTRPLNKNQKDQALGFRQEPWSLYEANRGDAWNGNSQFRRSQYFSIIAQAEGIVGSLDQREQTAGVVTTRRQFKPIALATQTSSDQRPRHWLISAFNTRVVRATRQLTGSALADYQLSPLTEQQILNQNNLPEAAYVSNVPGTFPPVPQPDANPQIEAVAYNRFRIQYQDESGGRTQDIDVIGSRTLTVYAFTVTVFALVPDDEDAYEVVKPSSAASSDPAVIARINPALPREPVPDPAAGEANDFVFEDTLLSARVIPLSLHSYNPVTNHTTLTAQATRGYGPGAVGFYAVVPIPPGALTVKIYPKNFDLAQQSLYRFYFDTARGYSAVLDSLATAAGQFTPFDPTTGEAFTIRIPNATDILIAPTEGQEEGTDVFTFVFEVNA